MCAGAWGVNRRCGGLLCAFRLQEIRAHQATVLHHRQLHPPLHALGPLRRCNHTAMKVHKCRYPSAAAAVSRKIGAHDPQSQWAGCMSALLTPSSCCCCCSRVQQSLLETELSLVKFCSFQLQKILLRRLLSFAKLEGMTHVAVDEVHEHSIPTPCCLSSCESVASGEP